MKFVLHKREKNIRFNAKFFSSFASNSTDTSAFVKIVDLRARKWVEKENDFLILATLNRAPSFFLVFLFATIFLLLVDGLLYVLSIIENRTVRACNVIYKRDEREMTKENNFPIFRIFFNFPIFLFVRIEKSKRKWKNPSRDFETRRCTIFNGIGDGQWVKCCIFKHHKINHKSTSHNFTRKMFFFWIRNKMRKNDQQAKKKVSSLSIFGSSGFWRFDGNKKQAQNNSNKRFYRWLIYWEIDKEKFPHSSHFTSFDQLRKF